MVEGALRLEAQQSEDARIFEIPLHELQESRRWEVRQVQRQHRTLPMLYFPHDGELLWGLSAYVVMHLLALTPDGAPLLFPCFRELDGA